MRIRLYCSFFGYLFLLFGCATGSKPAVETVKVDQRAIEEVAAEKDSTSPMPTDLLYLLLSAEIAGQKGAYEVALDNYIEAAKWSSDPKVAERATQIALFNKKQDKASEAVSLWIERDSDSVSARKISVLLNIREGNYGKALEEIKALASLSEAEFGKTVLEVASHLEKDADKTEAFDFMEDLSNEIPQRSDIHYAFSILALSQKDLDRANAEVERAIELRPDWTQARILQAQIIAQKGDAEKAISLLSDLVEDHPENEKVRMIYAQFLINNKDYSAAETELEQILSDNPEQYNAVYSLALVKLQSDKEDDARELFLKLTDYPKWQNQAYYYLGRIAIDRKEKDVAIGWFEKIMNEPLFLEAQTKIVSILASQEKADDAIQKLHTLQDRYPNYRHRFLLMEAELLNDREDYQRAFDILSRGLDATPDQPELLYSRALVAESLNRLDILEQDLKRILEKTPDDPNALNALGYTLVDRTDRYDEAQGYLERAIALKPDNPVIMDSYGWLQFRLGDLEVALDYLQRAYKKNADAEIASHLGEVFWVMGRKDEANAVWQEALSKDPKNKYLLKIKKRFPAAFRQ